MNSVNSVARNLIFGLSFIALMFVFVLHSPRITLAQSASIEPVSIDISPSQPEAGQDVRIYLDSSITDLNRATITWYRDGKTISTGTGITSTNIIAPNSGQSTTIIATIKTFEGRDIRKVITVTPTTIDLVWETNGYTPPLYNGRAAYVLGNTVTITAIPHFFDATNKMIDPANLIYIWKKGDKVLQKDSGFGKNSVTVESGVIDEDLEIEVQVTNKSSTISGRAGLAISPQTTKLRFYEDNDVYGLALSKQATVYKLVKPDVRITAVPYYFSKPDLNNGRVNFAWSINGSEATELSGDTSINLAKDEGSEGNAEISLTANNINHIFERAERSFNVFFTNENSDQTNNVSDGQ